MAEKTASVQNLQTKRQKLDMTTLKRLLSYNGRIQKDTRSRRRVHFRQRGGKRRIVHGFCKRSLTTTSHRFCWQIRRCLRGF